MKPSGFAIASRRSSRSRPRKPLIQRLRSAVASETVVIAAIVAAMAMLGGGNASMPIPRFAAELLAACLLTLSVASSRSVLPPRLVAADWLIVAIVVLLVLQMVPLPPAVWSLLPGRAIAVDIDNAVFGGPLWRALSLDPTSTIDSVMTLIPPLCVYAAIRAGDQKRFAAVVTGLLVAGAVGLVLGLLQSLLPGASWLQPYPQGDYGTPTGLFTNHNHQATFLVCLLPLAAMPALAVNRSPSNRIFNPAELWKLGATAFVVMLVLATGSRTGSLLLPVGIALTIAARRQDRLKVAARFAAVAAAVSVIIALGGNSLLSALHRTAIMADQRWNFYPDTLRAAAAFWPFGSGIGTFVQSFALYEPLSHVGQHYLNHAHNDFLEIAVEAGLPGVVLVAATILIGLQAARRAWFQASPADAFAMRARLASIPLFLLLIHSLFDYPMRTFAIAMLAAACWAVLADTPPLRRT